jgi:hypothetical protein
MAINEKYALDLASELSTIVDAPRTDEGIKAVARHLVSICGNDQEARWLVDEALFKWERWKGPHRLAEMLYDKQHPELPPPNQARPMPPREETHCKLCEDWGHREDSATELRVWCECEMGRWQESRHPGLVEALNRHRNKKLANILTMPPRQRVTQNDLDQAFRGRQNAVNSMVADARSVLADESSSPDRKEIARTTLKALGVVETEVSA